MTDSCQSTNCGCHGNPRFDGVDPRYQRVLWLVIAINAAMFLVEMTAGQLAGSQALQADALDFLGDTLTYGISLAVIGRPLQVRSGAALLKGGSLLLMGLWVFGSTLYHVLILGLPRAEIMGGVGCSRSPPTWPACCCCCATRTATPTSARCGCVRATMPSATSR